MRRAGGEGTTDADEDPIAGRHRLQVALLWGAFALVHGVYAAINLFDEVHLPFGDVVNVYRFWMDYAAEHGVIVGIDTSWVYPIGALLPMGFAYLLGPDWYGPLWLVLVTALDSVALAVLSRRWRPAAWWWVAFLAALGPVGLARLDAITAPIALIAVVWLTRHPAVAGALLGLAAWIKVWPVAIIGAALLALRSRSRVLLGALATTAGVLAVALALGAGPGVFGFVFQQTGRGLQVEAPISSIWLWAAVLGLPGGRVYYDTEILTYQVAGPGVQAVSTAMTPLLALALLVVVALGLSGLRRGADRLDLLVELTFALVLALIVVNKVGSPQFIGWLAAPVVLALLHGARALSPRAIVVLAVAALTQVLYPWLYDGVVSADPVVVSLLALRNLALVVMLLDSMRRLWMLGSHTEPPAERRRSPLAADVAE